MNFLDKMTIDVSLMVKDYLTEKGFEVQIEGLRNAESVNPLHKGDRTIVAVVEGRITQEQKIDSRTTEVGIWLLIPDIELRKVVNAD